MIAGVVSLSGYESQVAVLLDEEERMVMEFFNACAPEDPVIPGSGGFRKARWARRGQGKSGGFRVIYYFLTEAGQIYMSAIYAKSRKENLSLADRNVLEKLAAKKAAKGGRH